MPEDPRNNSRAPDPATDIFLCRTPPATNGPVMQEGNCTRLFAHPVPGSTPHFYLTYRSGPSDPTLIRMFESPTDAAAFIRGLAGPKLAGIPGPERHRIRNYFPDWFGCGDDDDPGEIIPCSPVQGCDVGQEAAMNPDIPAGPLACTGSRNSRSFPSPRLDPDTDTILFRSLRYNLNDGTRQEQGVDLFAVHEADGIPVLYFRHWSWCETGPGICQITSRDEAVHFIRKQFTKPGLFSGWNHRGLHEFLPEVYRKE